MLKKAIWSAAVALAVAVAGCGSTPSGTGGTTEDPTATSQQAVSLDPATQGGYIVNPPVGGTGGGRVYPLGCWQWNTVLTGFVVHDGDYIDSLATICQPLNQDGSVGPSWYTNGPGGGSGGTAHHAQCPANQFVRQMFYMAGNYINCMYMDCETVSGEGSYGWMGVGGGCSGYGYVDNCNLGYPYSDPYGAVTGFEIHSGSYIDNIQTVCEGLKM